MLLSYVKLIFPLDVEGYLYITFILHANLRGFIFSFPAVDVVGNGGQDGAGDHVIDMPDEKTPIVSSFHQFFILPIALSLTCE